MSFSHYEIRKGKYSLKGLPAVWAGEDEAETLEIILKDQVSNIEVSLLYGVLEADDIITRSAIIRNTGSEKVTIKKRQQHVWISLQGTLMWLNSTENIPWNEIWNECRLDMGRSLLEAGEELPATSTIRVLF